MLAQIRFTGEMRMPVGAQAFLNKNFDISRLVYPRELIFYDTSLLCAQKV